VAMRFERGNISCIVSSEHFHRIQGVRQALIPSYREAMTETNMSLVVVPRPRFPYLNHSAFHLKPRFRLSGSPLPEFASRNAWGPSEGLIENRHRPRHGGSTDFMCQPSDAKPLLSGDHPLVNVFATSGDSVGYSV